jgi:hypothetical protein
MHVNQLEAQHGDLPRPKMHGPTEGGTSITEPGQVKKPQTLPKGGSGKGSIEKKKKTMFKRVKDGARD